MPRNCDKTILEIKTAEKIMAKLLALVYLPPGFDIVECPKQQPHGQKGAGRQDQQQYGLRSRQCYGMSEQGTGSEKFIKSGSAVLTDLIFKRTPCRI